MDHPAAGKANGPLAWVKPKASADGKRLGQPRRRNGGQMAMVRIAEADFERDTHDTKHRILSSFGLGGLGATIATPWRR
jgi:hypothetical protein